jgi:peptidoglycan-N-acetylmuramic acid deacetylase
MSFIEEYNGYYIDRRYSDKDHEKVIYLTFDAGYENGNIAIILDTLREENVKGSFFILKNLMDKNPELVLRMEKEGHLVCNHTSTHVDITKLPDIDALKAELSALEAQYAALTGKPMAKYFRPPEGKFDRKSMQMLNELGYKTVFWSFAYADWDNNAQMSENNAKSKILENIHNGEIMLLHPTSSTNAKILKDVIVELKSQGYTFALLDQLNK